MNGTLSGHALTFAQAFTAILESQARDGTPINVPSSRYVTIALAAARTGYSAKAIERKKESGVWAEGDLWVKAPDGTILIDMEGYERWAVKAAGSRFGKNRSA